jgi:hypothetical protein
MGRNADETLQHAPADEWTLVLTRGGVELERRALTVGAAAPRTAGRAESARARVDYRVERREAALPVVGTLD